jgi:hypothetical protein
MADAAARVASLLRAVAAATVARVETAAIRVALGAVTGYVTDLTALGDSSD